MRCQALAGTEFASGLGRGERSPDVELVANRPRPELENLIGFFTNTVVLRAGLDGDPTAEELIRRARTTWLDAQLNQDVPFDDVVKELKPSRNPDQQQPFFDVMFQVVESAQADLSGGDCSAGWAIARRGGRPAGAAPPAGRPRRPAAARRRRAGRAR
jgi:non-ribosomal peptide synthetase component F